MNVFTNSALAGSSGQSGGAAGYAIERSLRFDSSASSYLNRTPSSAGNRKTWTWSGWIKRSLISSDGIFACGVNLYNGGAGGAHATAQLESSGSLQVYEYSGGYGYNYRTTQLFRDPAAWYHLIISLDTTNSTAGDRVKIYVNGERITNFSTSTAPSLDFEGEVNNNVVHYVGDNVMYIDGCLADIHMIDGQALSASDFGEYDDNNVWQPKKFEGTYGTNGFHLDFSDNSSNAALGTDSSGNGNTWTVNNLIAAGNSNNYTNAVTTTEDSGVFHYSTVPANLFSASTLLYGGYNSSNGNSNIIWTPPGGIAVNNPKITLSYYSAVKINGTAYTPTGSGELTIPFVGTLNTLLLENTDGSHTVVRAYGLKPDGTNLVTITDSASTDALRDSPSQIADQTDTGVGGEVVGNYATWNPLTNKGVVSTSNGNLEANTVGSGYGWTVSTIPLSSGKYYCEISFEGEMSHSTNFNYIGIVPASVVGNETNLDVFRGLGALAIESNSSKVKASIGTGSGATQSDWNTSYGFDETSTIGIAIDCDTPQVSFYKNGVSIGTFPYAMQADKSWVVFINDWANTSQDFEKYILNAGQRPFAFAAPSGFKSMCTANLPEPTIADGSTYFDTKLYTGNGSTQTVSGLNFSPDFLWYKSRSVAHHHGLQNTVTGVGKSLSSSNTAAEYTETTGLDAFTSDGFNLDGDGYYSINRSGHSMVAWAWDAASSNTTIAAGGLNSSVYDQSQTWSNNVTNASGAYGAASQAFDGSLTTHASPSNSSPMTYTNPSASDTVISTFEIYIDIYSMTGITLELNSTDITSQVSTTAQWHTITGFSGQNFSNLKWNAAPGDYEVRVKAVKVNGKTLVDSGVTPPNVPSIASTVRANPSAGFSIVKWTGSSSAETVGHGLNARPDFMICKKTSVGGNSWVVWHKSLADNKYLILNSSVGQATDETLFNSHVNDNSSVFSLGTNSSISDTSQQAIAYLFSGVEGYSAFGSYTGNGSADGPFVYTGFKIGWLMVKSSSNSGEHWLILDTARDPHNLADATIYANLSNAEAEASALGIDILSNGFKPRGTNAGANASNYTYVYAAFAEHPFKNSRAS